MKSFSIIINLNTKFPISYLEESKKKSTRTMASNGSIPSSSGLGTGTGSGGQSKKRKSSHQSEEDDVCQCVNVLAETANVSILKLQQERDDLLKKLTVAQAERDMATKKVKKMEVKRLCLEIDILSLTTKVTKHKATLEKYEATHKEIKQSLREIAEELKGIHLKAALLAQGFDEVPSQIEVAHEHESIP